MPSLLHALREAPGDRLTLAVAWGTTLLLACLTVWAGSLRPLSTQLEMEVAFGETVLDFAGAEPQPEPEPVVASEPDGLPTLHEPRVQISAEAALEPPTVEPTPVPPVRAAGPPAVRPTRSAGAKTASATSPSRPASAAPSGVVSGAARKSASVLRCPLPPYPAAARAAEFEGRVVLRVQVGPDGRPRSAAVERSSGRVDCDQAARETVLRNWSFRPATEAGRSIEASLTLAVRFALDA